jgi:hypothetical protein
MVFIVIIALGKPTNVEINKKYKEREGLSLCGHKVGDYSVLAPRTPQL